MKKLDNRNTNVILTIIAVLLALQLLARCINPVGVVKALDVQDVNVYSIGGRRVYDNVLIVEVKSK